MRNKKGAVTVLTIFLWYSASVVVGAVALTPSFRERKAMAYCQQEGGDESFCKDQVAGMSKTEVLAYIKDTAERPRN